MKIVALSDTHGQHRKIKNMPEGDVLVFAGDMTKHGRLNEVKDFADWFGSFPHEHKLVVAGNHDFCFDGNKRDKALKIMRSNDITYLENEAFTIEGVNFYGSPHSNSFDRYVFTDSLKKIPDYTHVLITHGPPKGTLDNYSGGDWGSIGCEKLAEQVEGLDLKAHIFGHVHEQYGKEGNSYNVSVLDEDYNRIHSVTEIEIEK